MKLVCSQSELSAAVALVGRAVASRPTHPILANVLLTADASTGQLQLTGFDLNLGMQTSIPASVETSGATTVPARLFGEIVSRLPNDAAITLNADEQLEITTSSGSYRVATQPADDFPDLPAADGAAALRLPAADLIRGLKATLFASSSDESKQLLTGVHLAIGGATTFAATDGHRLAVLKLGSGSTDTELTVPARSLRELERLVAATGVEAVSIAAASGQILFRCGDRLLTSRSLDGTYPNYGQLIPATFSRSIVVNRKALQGALERVAVLADQHNNVVKLKADPDRAELLVTADVQDVGSGAEMLAAEVSGDAITIAFNVRYVLDGLKAMSTEEVAINANYETTPVVIVGDPGYTYLVMPVQVKS